MMVKKTALVTGLFLSILSNASFAEENEPLFRTSKDTKDFFEKGVKSCAGYIRNANSAQIMFGMSSNSMSSNNEKVYMAYTLKSFLKEINCSKEFIDQFTKKRTAENIDYYKFKSRDFEKDILDFKERGLGIGGPAKAYLDFVKNSGLEGSDVNSNIEKMLAEHKEKAKERRKSCGNTMNLKEPLSLDKPRHQDSIGWCYAFTASDLLSNAIGKDISPAYAAMLYNDKILNRIIHLKEGGFTSDAMEEIIEEGVCLEKNLPSDDYHFSQSRTNLSNIYDDIVKLKREYTSKKQVFGPDRKVENNREMKYSKWDVQVSLCTENSDKLPAIGTLFPHLTLEQLIEILMSTKPNTFKKLADTCPKENVPELKDLKVKVDDNKKTIYKTMDDQLDKGNIVGIGYVAEVLKGHKEADAYFANHASSIVGRRFNEETMSCEYLLRNTWGTSCGSYSRDYECNNGHAWIGEDYFKYNNAIKEVQYVEKK